MGSTVHEGTTHIGRSRARPDAVPSFIHASGTLLASSLAVSHSPVRHANENRKRKETTAGNGSGEFLLIVVFVFFLFFLFVFILIFIERAFLGRPNARSQLRRLGRL